jgi:acyl-CoA dehydrogenase
MMLGETAKRIQVGRLLTMHAAWLIDQGNRARRRSRWPRSRSPTSSTGRPTRPIQLCGAKGYSKDTVLEWIYRYARCARLVDGASEVHQMVLARHYGKLGNEFWSWGA